MIVTSNLEEEVFKRRTSNIQSLGSVAYADAPGDPVQARVDEFLQTMREQLYGPSDRSKWERIGRPMVEHVIDIGIILWPTTPPKMRQKAMQRTIERFIELT